MDKLPRNGERCFYYIEKRPKKQATLRTKDVDKQAFFCGDTCGQFVDKWISSWRRKEVFFPEKECGTTKKGVVPISTESCPLVEKSGWGQCFEKNVVNSQSV